MNTAAKLMKQFNVIHTKLSVSPLNRFFEINPELYINIESPSEQEPSEEKHFRKLQRTARM